MSITVNDKNLGHATAYGYAKAAGYTGTESEFSALMASYASVAQSASASASSAASSAASAAESLAALSVDVSLSGAGRPADAKATGEELAQCVSGVVLAWTEGQALTTEGTTVSVSGYAASDFIKISEIVKSSTFYKLRQRPGYTIVPICFYDAAQAFIGYHTEGSNNAAINVSIADVIGQYPGAEYLRVGKSDADEVTVSALSLTGLDARVSAMAVDPSLHSAGAAADAKATGDGIAQCVSGVALTWTDESALTTSGTLVSMSGYSASDFLPLSGIVKGSTFYNLRQRQGYTIAPICFYDGEKAFLGFYTESTKNAAVNVVVSDILGRFPGAEYIRVGKSDADAVTVSSLSLASLDERMTAAEERMERAESAVYPSYKYNLFSKAIFCGDSVTAGFVVEGTEENPKTVYAAMPAYSHPTQFGKIHPQVTVENRSRSGISVSEFYAELYPGIDFSLYDLIVIELGYNPGTGGYLNAANLETEGTNASDYRAMAAAIRAQNADAVIALVRSSDEANTRNWPAVLETIAAESGCVVIDLTDTTYLDLNDKAYHGYTVTNGAAALDSAHFTRAGYNAKAYVLSRLLADKLP